METSARRWTRTGLIVGLWGVVIVHCLPLPGLLGAALLQRLYAIEGELPATIELLLQHRALLFALLSVPLARALMGHGPLRSGCLLLLASDLAFALLCLQHWPVDAALQRVLLFDLASILVLGAALAFDAVAGLHALRR